MRSGRGRLLDFGKRFVKARQVESSHRRRCLCPHRGHSVPKDRALVADEALNCERGFA